MLSRLFRRRKPDFGCSESVIELCTGAAGGWTAGLWRAGFCTYAGCESVPWRRALWSELNPGALVYDDLRTLTGRQVRKDLGFAPDLVVGSPPCPEYSSVNWRGGKGLESDDLFLHAVRLVDELRPSWAAFENSAFVKTRGFDRIAERLEAIGYACWPLVVGLGSAGAAHERDRVILLCADGARLQGWAAGQSWPLGALEAGLWDRPHLEGDGVRLGPVGAGSLGRHLREYAGVPSWQADLCREAYGDAVSPTLTEAVGWAIRAVEGGLSVEDLQFRLGTELVLRGDLTGHDLSVTSR